MDRTPSAPSTVLAFDFGTRRIGVAVGNTLTRTARALFTIDAEASATRFAAVRALIEEWRPARLVIGIPVHEDGTPHATSARAQRFARQLAGRFALPVVEVDERHTTGLAHGVLAGQGRAARGSRDAIAAQIILQAYFDERQPA